MTDITQSEMQKKFQQIVDDCIEKIYDTNGNTVKIALNDDIKRLGVYHKKVTEFGDCIDAGWRDPLIHKIEDYIKKCMVGSEDNIDISNCVRTHIPIEGFYRARGIEYELSDEDDLNELINFVKLDTQTEVEKTFCKFCRSIVLSEDPAYLEGCHAECKHIMKTEGTDFYNAKLEKFKNIISQFPQFQKSELVIKPDEYAFAEMMNAFQFLTNIEPINWDRLYIGAFGDNEPVIPVSLHTSENLLELVNGDEGDSGHIMSHRIYNLAKEKMSYTEFLRKIAGYGKYGVLGIVNQELSYHFDKVNFSMSQELKAGHDAKFIRGDSYEAMAIQEKARSVFNMGVNHKDYFRIDELEEFIDMDAATESIADYVLSYEDMSNQQKVDWLNYVANDFKTNPNFPFYKIIDGEFVFVSIPNIF